jgi:hypothetical protein
VVADKSSSAISSALLSLQIKRGVPILTLNGQLTFSMQICDLYLELDGSEMLCFLLLLACTIPTSGVLVG